MPYVHPTHRITFTISPKVAMGRGKQRRLFEQFAGGVQRRVWHEVRPQEIMFSILKREVMFSFVATEQDLEEYVAACQRLVEYVWYADARPILGYELSHWGSCQVIVQVGIAK
jgi:hypothetical protein